MRMQRTSAATSSSPRQASAQATQAWAQSEHASMQATSSALSKVGLLGWAESMAATNSAGGALPAPFSSASASDMSGSFAARRLGGRRAPAGGSRLLGQLVQVQV